MAEHEFKREDRVVFVRDDEYGGVEMPKGTRGTYVDDSPTDPAPYVLLDTGMRVRAWRDSIAHVEDHGTGDGSASDICAEPGCNCDLERRFPAPLDPAKVKPGDTVTLEMEGGRKVTAPVSEHTLPGKAPGTWFLDVYRDRGPVSFSAVHWTLTDHQPATEPKTPADVDMWAAKDALQAEVAAEVLQTPAPLDPKNVKPGDTVTLRIEHPSRPVLYVAGMTHALNGAGVYLGGWRVDDLPDYVTLIAHQPAPEPEPEWKPGTVLLGNLPGPYPDDQFWVVDDGETNPYVVDDTGVKHYPADLLNVREAVVIDPATVDVEALQAAIAGANGGAEARAVLQFSGIEVPR